ncbi:Hypothetical protein SRAE_2000478400 [Strongyloides ratti]|uniref:Protein quiver n=1 Tax=Strongyloides ratti TaxID=34506 RepID=A0A090LPP1_STRRB|nr:Hypothetical protein SRAE_2000478400 [Strongyloides ratti]CEF70149.1 Hypothetical protein SRAE_2000478400 [Strongyloides ratti]
MLSFVYICNGNITNILTNNKSINNIKNLIETTNLKVNKNLKCYSYLHGYENYKDKKLEVVQCDEKGDKCIHANSTINYQKMVWLGCASDYSKFINVTYNPNNYITIGCKNKYVEINGFSYSYTFCVCSYDLCNMNKITVGLLCQTI